MPPIGAHVQIKGGLATVGLAYTDAVAARAVQVFVGNPRGWRLTPGDPRQDARFTAGCAGSTTSRVGSGCSTELVLMLFMGMISCR